MIRFLLLLVGVLVWAVPVLAVPETVSLRVTDVTPRSLNLVWMSNQPIEPAVEVFADAGMTEELTSLLKIESNPDLSASVAEAANAKRIYSVRVSGLQADTEYFVRSLSRDVNDLLSVGYSALQTATTASRVKPFTGGTDESLFAFNNDLLTFGVYIRPVDQGEAFAGLGDLLLLEIDSAAYPVTAFAGAGIPTGEAVIDLNNLFDLNRISLPLAEEAVVKLRVYRGDTLSTLYHVRKLPISTTAMAIVEAERGWNLADLNLDGQIDQADFLLFKEQYLQTADAHAYNPDFNFAEEVDSAAEQIDLRDFGWFAGQFGKSKQ
jgi:hypothetical protein